MNGSRKGYPTDQLLLYYSYNYSTTVLLVFTQSDSCLAQVSRKRAIVLLILSSVARYVYSEFAFGVGTRAGALSAEITSARVERVRSVRFEAALRDVTG